MKRHTILLIQELLSSEPDAIVSIGSESYDKGFIPILPPRDPRLTDEVKQSYVDGNAECFQDWDTAVDSAEQEWEHSEDADLIEQLELDEEAAALPRPTILGLPVEPIDTWADDGGATPDKEDEQ